MSVDVDAAPRRWRAPARPPPWVGAVLDDECAAGGEPGGGAVDHRGDVGEAGDAVESSRDQRARAARSPARGRGRRARLGADVGRVGHDEVDAPAQRRGRASSNHAAHEQLEAHASACAALAAATSSAPGDASTPTARTATPRDRQLRVRCARPMAPDPQPRSTIVGSGERERARAPRRRGPRSRDAGSGRARRARGRGRGTASGPTTYCSGSPARRRSAPRRERGASARRRRAELLDQPARLARLEAERRERVRQRGLAPVTLGELVERAGRPAARRRARRGRRPGTESSVVGRQVDPVVGDPVLLEVVRADLLAAPAAAQLGALEVAELAGLGVLGRLEQPASAGRPAPWRGSGAGSSRPASTPRSRWAGG